MAVRKTTLEIDEEVLAQVREILGTTGIKDTVDAAFRDVRRREAIDRQMAWLAEHGDEILEARRTAWQRRT